MVFPCRDFFPPLSCLFFLVFFGDLLPQAGLAAEILSVAASCLNGQVTEAGLEALAALQVCWVGGVSVFPALGRPACSLQSAMVRQAPSCCAVTSFAQRPWEWD